MPSCSLHHISRLSWLGQVSPSPAVFFTDFQPCPTVCRILYQILKFGWYFGAQKPWPLLMHFPSGFWDLICSSQTNRHRTSWIIKQRFHWLKTRNTIQKQANKNKLVTKHVTLRIKFRSSRKSLLNSLAMRPCVESGELLIWSKNSGASPGRSIWWHVFRAQNLKKNNCQ